MFKLVVLTALLAAAAAQSIFGYGHGAPLGYNGGYYPYSSYPQYSPYYNYNSPLATTYASPLAPAVAPVPYSPAAHLIKKRSVVATAPVVAPTSYYGSSHYVPTSYVSSGSYYPGYPYASSYLAGAAPLAQTYSYSSPLVSSAVAPVHYATPYSTAYSTPYSHLIKKRSVVAAPVVSAPLTTGYVAPHSFVPTTYATAAHSFVPTTYNTAPYYTNAFGSQYTNAYPRSYYNYGSPYLAPYSNSFYVKK